MNILDMTLRQIIHSINIGEILIALSFILNFEATVRQVAVNKGYSKAVTWCDKIAAAITFILDVFSTVKNKAIVPVILVCVGLMFASGCASSGANGFCGRVSGQGLTVPYVGGKANVDGFNCHVGCVGKCPESIYTALSAEMKSYADSQTTNGQIMTTGPGTVQFIPSK